MAYILIVDDEVQIGKVLAKIFKQEGYDAHFAKNGQEALGMVEEKVPDLVITDIIMPEVEGLELIRKLKKHSATIKIMAISGGGGYLEPEGQLAAAQILGADVCFTKPVNSNELLAAIKALLEPERK